MFSLHPSTQGRWQRTEAERMDGTGGEEKGRRRFDVESTEGERRRG